MPGSELVQSLGRGLDMLTILGNSGGEMGLAEIARTAGLKPTTAHNLLRTLESRDFVCKDKDLKYRLGNAFRRMSDSLSLRISLSAAELMVNKLARRIPGAVITYSELVSGSAAVRLRCSPDSAGVLQHPVNVTLHPYASATGLCALAFADGATTDSIEEAKPFLEFGMDVWKSRSALLKILGKVKKDGVAALPYEMRGRLSMAVPIFCEKGHPRGFLGVSVKCQKKDFGKLSKNIAKQIDSMAKLPGKVVTGN